MFHSEMFWLGDVLVGDVTVGRSPSEMSGWKLFTRQKNPNPTELYINNGRDLVQRTIVFRNTTGKDFILKVISSSPSIVFPTNVFRFTPLSQRLVQFRVATGKLGQWEKMSLSIKGYVIPVYSKSWKTFIDQKTVGGTADQEAFSLSVRITEQFSAPHTVVNLPGSATCIESADKPVEVMELDTSTAVNIEKDVATATAIGSMKGFVEENKRRQTNRECWLSNFIFGRSSEKHIEKKSMRSTHSSDSSNNSAKNQPSCRTEASKKIKDVNASPDAKQCGKSITPA